MKPFVPAALLSLSLLAACGSGTDASSDGKISVVASFYPAAFVAEKVGGDLIDVDTLTAPGGEPHDLELTPKQVGSVQDADVVVYLKNFQSAVDEAVEQADREDGTTVDLSDGVTLLAATEEEEHEHSEEETDDHAHEEEESGHDHGANDPHIWLAPKNLVPAATSMAATLSDLDPDHAEEYQANAEAFVAELDELDTAYSEGLATCERREFVTSHAAFAYLANAYDLTQIPIAGIDPSSEPSSKALGEIAETVKEHGITTIFTETLVSPAIAETLARETGATTATLNPIEGLTEDQTDEDYISLMRTNLSELEKANDCR